MINPDLIKGTTLYDNSTGSTGTITLSDSASNYNFIEIYFYSSDNDYSSAKIYNPNNKKVSLTTGSFFGTQLYIKSANRTITDNTISLSDGYVDTEWNIINSTANSSADSKIYIYQVIGYK